MPISASATKFSISFDDCQKFERGDKFLQQSSEPSINFAIAADTKNFLDDVVSMSEMRAANSRILFGRSVSPCAILQN